MLARRSNIPLYLLCIIYATSAELEQQNPIKTIVHKTLKATARSCMSTVNATEADLEYLIKDPPFPEKSACIITCLLDKIGIVKNEKYSKIGFITIVAPLVIHNDEKLQHMKTVSENCDKEFIKPVLCEREVSTTPVVPALFSCNAGTHEAVLIQYTYGELLRKLSPTIESYFTDFIKFYQK